VVVGSQGGVNAIGVDITPLAYDECITKTPDNYSIAGVNPANGDGAFNVAGYTQGHTAVRARWGHETTSPIISNGGTLNVCVKDSKVIPVDVHYVRDNAPGTTFTTNRPTLAAELFVQYMNEVWLPQANIEFTLDSITTDTVTYDMDGVLDYWTTDTVHTEWAAIKALREAMGTDHARHVHVYFVSAIKSDGKVALGLAGPQDAAISDAGGGMALYYAISHEIGHALGLFAPENADYGTSGRNDELMYREASGSFIRHYQVDFVHEYITDHQIGQ
jgi:hypothetical protein